MKTQKFDVLGNVRRRKKFVSVLIKTHPKKVINTKFILSESVTQRRTRVASLANRLHHKAPTVEEVRNYGSYKLLEDGMDKKHSYNGLIERNNLMITANLN